MRNKNNSWDVLLNGVVETDEDGDVMSEVLGLKQLALAQLPFNEPDVDLILAMIISAGKERDYRYITSGLFWSDCAMIGLNPSKVRKIIIKIWEKESE